MNKNFEFTHPEIVNGEVFFTNTNKSGFDDISWVTKRKGVFAYDGNGGRIPRSDWFPVFVSISELQERNETLQEARSAFNLQR